MENAMFGSSYINLDPAWPWSLPGWGPTALIAAALVLTALTIWTYLGARGASVRRVSVVLLLRLFALVIPFLLVLRPSLAFEEDDARQPTKLLILLDYSRSMEFTDDFNSRSRWESARRILSHPGVVEALKRLAGEKVEIVYYQGAEDLRPYDPASKPDGNRTDIGLWLHEILQRHGAERNLRGLVLLSDGADNGRRYSSREKASQFRGFCPIYAFALGKPTTTSNQNDIAFVDIFVEPAPVPVKTKLTVKGIVNAPGFEDNANVTARLFIDRLDGKGNQVAAPAKQFQLKKTENNEVVMVCDAPDTAGEIKVTLKIDPLIGEVTESNNEISTYVNVTTEGVSVLWVEARKRLESTFAIRHALSRDPRFRIYYAERNQDAKAGADQEDWFNFDKRHYDVIVVGDISARRFCGNDSKVLSRIRDKVTNQKTGLVFLGGLDALAASDWGTQLAAPLRDLMPIDPSIPPEPREIEGKVRVIPTAAGLTYLLRLDENANANGLLWNQFFAHLDGVTNLGRVRPTATILATGETGERSDPILASTTQGGRVVVFGGDTTYRAWRRNPESLPAYERFWKQLMLYAAQQENIDSSVWVKLEKRRVSSGMNLRVPFTVGVRGKNGQNVPNPQFKVKVIGPNKEETEVPITSEGGQYQGYFWKTDLSGEYRIEAYVSGKDAEGNDLSGTPGVARFLGYAEDLEILRTAADHESLEKLALDSGGRFQLADERRLQQFLEELATAKASSSRPKVDLWPDWRQSLPPGSPAGEQLEALWSSAALPCFVLFVTILCVEWFLRRRWGLV